MKNLTLFSGIFSAMAFAAIVPASAKDFQAELSPDLQQQSRCVAWAVIVEQERQGDKNAWPAFPDTDGKAQTLGKQLAEEISDATGADETDIRGYFVGLIEEIQNMAFSDAVGEHGQPLENPDAPAQFEALSEKCAPVISKLLE